MEKCHNFKTFQGSPINISEKFEDTMFSLNFYVHFPKEHLFLAKKLFKGFLTNYYIFANKL